MQALNSKVPSSVVFLNKWYDFCNLGAVAIIAFIIFDIFDEWMIFFLICIDEMALFHTIGTMS